MYHFNYCLLYLSVLFSCYGKLTAAESACGVDWLPYKDEKCFRVIDDTLRTFDDAQKACTALESDPTLPIVRSKEEQDFLSNYLFKTLKKLDNFWIGAKFSLNSSHFKWLDNSDLAYTNWDTKVVENKENQCVQIQADDRVAGKWIDEPCGRKNAVVCQKLQTWSLALLQKAFLDERKLQQDALESANQKIAELKQSLNVVPVGFTYMQLPNEKSPSEVWPAMKWTDVSSAYAGVFFRVGGGGAATFGQVQDENSPHLTQIMNEVRCSNTGQVSTSIGNLSSTVLSGTWTSGSENTLCLKFQISGEEVRPRNMAIRVWKRTG